MKTKLVTLLLAAFTLMVQAQTQTDDAVYYQRHDNDVLFDAERSNAEFDRTNSHVHIVNFTTNTWSTPNATEWMQPDAKSNLVTTVKVETFSTNWFVKSVYISDAFSNEICIGTNTFTVAQIQSNALAAAELEKLKPQIPFKLQQQWNMGFEEGKHMTYEALQPPVSYGTVSAVVNQQEQEQHKQ